MNPKVFFLLSSMLFVPLFFVCNSKSKTICGVIDGSKKSITYEIKVCDLTENNYDTGLGWLSLFIIRNISDTIYLKQGLISQINRMDENRSIWFNFAVDENTTLNQISNYAEIIAKEIYSLDYKRKEEEFIIMFYYDANNYILGIKSSPPHSIP